jgi:polyphosphate kinase
VAPDSVRSGLLARIRRETTHAREGRPARIRIKANSIVDEEIVDALYAASRAGVTVEALIRGICALRPGVPGLSESVRVRSVLGRFLEHSRVFWFENDTEPEAWIGSADLMHRNLDRRVEVLVRVPGQEEVDGIGALLDLAFGEETDGWDLGPDGTWHHRPGDVHLQETLIERRRSRRH